MSKLLIPVDHKFCAYCGKPMEMVEKQETAFNRTTGKKEVLVTYYTWRCTDFNTVVFSLNPHDTIYLS